MITLISFLLTFNQAQAAPAPAPMSLESYMQQVEQQDPGTKAANMNQQAQQHKADEADLQTAVRVEGQASHMDDKRPTLIPAFMGSRTTNTSYSLGLAQQAPYGVRWKLSGNIVKTKLYDLNGTNPAFQDVYPQLELEIPLWRNLFGHETKAMVEQARLAQKAMSVQADIQKINRRNEAELAYWQVANIQEKMRILKENIDRAQKILSWNQNRVKNNLADRSDLYQAQAMMKSRELELVASELELENYRRQFNQMRGANLDEPVANLQFIEVSDNQLQSLVSARKRNRLDLLATKYQLLAAEKAAVLGREKIRPDVKLFATGSLVGRDSHISYAYTESIEGTHPYSLIGIKISTALDAVGIHEVVKGYRLEQQAKELELAQKRKDSEREWSNYQTQLNNISSQLRLVRNLETIQKQKTDNERERLRTGRTVTYQVLMFEQDLASTQAQRLALEMKARQLIANLNMFVEESL